jgi:hypothetical protein
MPSRAYVGGKNIRRYSVVVSAMLLVAIMVLSGLSLSTAAKRNGPIGLSAEEIAFAKAVGVGDYAYGINEVYAYEYGEIEMELGWAWRGVGANPRTSTLSISPKR